MANFWEISETVLLENSSIKKSWVPLQFFEKTGRELDRFTGKLIHQKIMSTFSFFLKIWSWAWPFYWKTHPNVNWRFLGRHTGRFTGKFIQTKCHISYMLSVKKIRMDEFSSKTACVTTQKMKNIWMTFPWFANKG